MKVFFGKTGNNTVCSDNLLFSLFVWEYWILSHIFLERNCESITDTYLLERTQQSRDKLISGEIHWGINCDKLQDSSFYSRDRCLDWFIKFSFLLNVANCFRVVLNANCIQCSLSVEVPFLKGSWARIWVYCISFFWVFMTFYAVIQI